MNAKVSIFSLLFLCGMAHTKEVEMIEVPLERAKECAKAHEFLEYEKNRNEMQMLSLALNIKNSIDKGETEGLKQFSEIMLKNGETTLLKILKSESSSQVQKIQARELLEKLN